ncbi:hypothetical protein CTHBC1_2648 [Acetivibrio thermocellus BC1]|nr:hypothetical protein CTHBC1_2648 [Acetivibrio thermocellus BC1]
MTKAETVKLLAVINAAYPNMQISEATVSVWHELLGDLNINLVLAATKKLILESPYPPTIADIRKRAVEIMTLPEDRINAAEAWGEVEKAIRWYGYYREAEALASMSPRTAKVVRYIGWREICLSEEPGVVRGQFMRMYTQVAEREQKEQLLPASLKETIQKLANEMNVKMLEEKTG